jgi:hypothetical protein
MTAADRHDAQRALNRPAPTIPKCAKCSKQRVLYGGLCGPCGDAEVEADRQTEDALETRRESRKGFGGKGRGR